jgi:hypothetical protein
MRSFISEGHQSFPQGIARFQHLPARFQVDHGQCPLGVLGQELLKVFSQVTVGILSMDRASGR